MISKETFKVNRQSNVLPSLQPTGSYFLILINMIEMFPPWFQQSGICPQRRVQQHGVGQSWTWDLQSKGCLSGNSHHLYRRQTLLEICPLAGRGGRNLIIEKKSQYINHNDRAKATGCINTSWCFVFKRLSLSHPYLILSLPVLPVLGRHSGKHLSSHHP